MIVRPGDKPAFSKVCVNSLFSRMRRTLPVLPSLKLVKGIKSGSDSESTWLSTNAPAALLYACLIEGYVYMKGEADMMSVYNARYESALGRLRVLGDARDRKDTYRSGQFTIPVS